MKLLPFSELAGRFPGDLVLSQDGPSAPWSIGLYLDGKQLWLETARDEVRRFKTLDAVFQVLQGIATREGAQLQPTLFVNPEGE